MCAGSPSLDELQALGVARASTATAMPPMMGVIRDLTRGLCARGRFDAINSAMSHPEVRELFSEWRES